MSVFSLVKKYSFAVLTNGCRPEYGQASNRITIFTNTLMIIAFILAFTVYDSLEMFNVPAHISKVIQASSTLGLGIILFHYYQKHFWARFVGLTLLNVIGWNAMIFMGKSFNGHYIFFVGIIYSVLAFSKYQPWVRLLLVLYPYINLPLSDVFYHRRIFPVTGISSFDFPLTLTLVDSFSIPILIIVMVAIEKGMADRYEAQLEVALDTIQKEKQKIQVVFNSVDIGILMVDQNLKIEPEYSKQVEKIFATDEIAGQNLLPLLFAGKSLDGETPAIVKNSLFNIIGEDSLNWDLNHDQLIKEVEVLIQGETRYLSLSWSPIIRNDLVKALVLGIKDITQEVLAQKRLAKDLLLQSRAQEVLGCLIRVGMRQTQAFLTDLSKFLAGDSRDASPSRLRDLHTLKGEARLIGLQSIAQLTHDLETGFAEKRHLQSSFPEWTALSEYSHLLQEAGQLMFKDRESDQHWSVFSYVESLRRRIETQLDKLQGNLRVGSIGLEDGIGQWPAALEKPVKTILLHAFQNAVDHGYVIPGKNEDIRLNVTAERKGQNFCMTIEDFGSGLNMEKIQKKWAQLPQELKSKAPTPVDLLFLDDQSTSDQVTETSGRGVGLSAIRAMVEDLKGHVMIENATHHPGTVLRVEIPWTESHA